MAFRPFRPLLPLALGLLTAAAALAQDAAPKITHSFLATGPETRIVDGSGKVVWSYPKGTRDGWVLPNGNLLLTLSGKPGSVVEVTRDQKVVFEFQGSQDELDTAQRLRNGNTLISEAGKNPRLLEVDPEGKIVKELPLPSQRNDTHMQQRMSRRLRNGNTLVPHLWDRVVREYSPDGKPVWEVKTPHMPFTAIRLENGNTLIGCTWGNLVIEVDPKGETVWQVTNDDLPGDPLNDCCGVQRLPNGNTVITSYRAKPNETRLTEITRDKQIVWTYTDDRPGGIHHFQILDTNGERLRGRPMR
ncbi:MAG: hypothetical protein ACK47B_21265 [Armatimonadota bacterium]